MKISSTMDLGQLASIIGADVEEEYVRDVRAVMVERNMTGKDTSEVPKVAWLAIRWLMPLFY